MDPFAADDLIFAIALLQAVIALLVLRFLDVYEREPLGAVFAMFTWGAIGAALLASAGNVALQDQLSDEVRTVFGAAISAPLIEESAKGLALLLAFGASWLVYRRWGVLEFDGVTDGIVYGAAIGIGFAFTEDLFYFFREARVNGLADAVGVFVDRRDFAGPATLRHAIWTATFGAGLGLATHSRRWLGKLGWPLAGLLLAMLLHATNNGLIQIWLSIKYGLETTYDYLAVGVPVVLADRMDSTVASAETALEAFSWIYVVAFFAAIAAGILFQRRVIKTELRAEVEAGLIDETEFNLAVHPTRRIRTVVGSLWAGDLERTRYVNELTRELAELAFAKRRTDSARVQRELGPRRERISELRD